MLGYTHIQQSQRKGEMPETPWKPVKSAAARPCVSWLKKGEIDTKSA